MIRGDYIFIRALQALHGWTRIQKRMSNLESSHVRHHSDDYVHIIYMVQVSMALTI